MIQSRFAVFIAFLLLSCLSARASELDDRLELGGFRPDMTLDEADRLAGKQGTRECTTWPPNPTVHWCEWRFNDASQRVALRYGADGRIHDIDRCVPVPDAMRDEEALSQAAEKFKRYGPPARDVIPGNLHWGCRGDDCSGPRILRVWISDGPSPTPEVRRSLCIGWGNRILWKKNQDRFEKESKQWHEKSRKPEDKSRLNL